MLSTQPVKSMHDFNEALHSQNYVSSLRTTSRTDMAIRQERTFIFVAFMSYYPCDISIWGQSPL